MTKTLTLEYPYLQKEAKIDDGIIISIKKNALFGNLSFKNSYIYYKRTIKTTKIDKAIVTIKKDNSTYNLTIEIIYIYWKDICAGGNHSIALKSDNSLWVWGFNYYGQLGVNNSLDSSIPLKLKDKYIKIGAGVYHTVAIKEDGTLWSWGNNENGELGDGTTKKSLLPKQIGKDTNWYKISVGDKHTIALKKDGTLFAWGNNQWGQLGDNSIENKLTPTQENSKSKDWIEIATGEEHTVALKKDGTLFAWGRNNYGQLGIGTSNFYEYKTTPTQEITKSKSWSFISSGSGSFTVAIKKNGTLFAWGSNEYGELGDGTTQNKQIPTQEKTKSKNWIEASVGNRHTIALKKDGTLFAWGRNDYGELGDGTTKDRLIPTQERLKSKKWEKVSVGVSHSLALNRDGSIYAWGWNEYGQLANSSEDIKLLATKIIPKGSIFKKVATKHFHTILIANDGTLWGWGKNLFGELGDGTKESKNFLVQEKTLSNDWIDIAVGNYHTVALKKDKTLWGWGNNSYGQIGEGEDSLVPKQISKEKFLSIDAGAYQTVAIKEDKTICSFGKISINSKEYFQSLSVGDYHIVAIKEDKTISYFKDNSYKQALKVEGKFKKVKAGAYHTVAIKEDGTLWSWGDNDAGVLGEGTTKRYFKEIQEKSLSNNWVDIYAGVDYTVGVKEDKTIYVWGYNANGVLGVGDKNHKYFPIEQKNFKFKELSTGKEYIVAIGEDNNIYLWGKINYGLKEEQLNPKPYILEKDI